MSTIKLGNDYLVWIGAPGAIETALNPIQGQGTITISRSQTKIDMKRPGFSGGSYL